MYAVVGFDLDENQVLAPTGMNAVRLYRGNFHWLLLNGFFKRPGCFHVMPAACAHRTKLPYYVRTFSIIILTATGGIARRQHEWKTSDRLLPDDCGRVCSGPDFSRESSTHRRPLSGRRHLRYSVAAFKPEAQ